MYYLYSFAVPKSSFIQHEMAQISQDAIQNLFLEARIDLIDNISP